jgi:serine/threonine-protein kinase
LHKTIALPGRRNVTLVSELGRGTAAVAFRGIIETDSFIRRPVAVKLYDLTLNDEPEASLVALGRIVQRAAYVVHPNAVQIYEMALVGRSHVAVVTELVEGTTLERLVQGYARARRRMPLDLALFVTTEIAEALSGARMATTPEGVHAGMAHLDVSLRQVLLSFHGEVKLSDFGLSQVALWGSSIRPIQSISERWGSVAPEVAQGLGGDARSDVFSLGIMLREMLIGPRFPADLSDAQAMEYTRDGVIPPTFMELQLPAQVSAIIRKALEPDPARRYAHATAMAYELRRVALSMGVGDGRMFLRTAIAEATTTATVPPPAPEPMDPDTTEELRAMREPADFPEGIFDEVDTPRMVADRTSGLILKADRSGTRRGAL